MRLSNCIREKLRGENRMRTKSKGRIAEEKAIVNKIQSLFDNAEFIQHFTIEVTGGVSETTCIKYEVEEFLIPEKSEEEK